MSPTVRHRVEHAGGDPVADGSGRGATRAAWVGWVAPLAAAAAVGLCAAPAIPAAAATGRHREPARLAPQVAVDTDWPVYHHDPEGSGIDSSGTSLTPSSAAWTSGTLDGEIFGEPLESTNRVYVATENDTVYALAADTGAVLWSAHVGTPVPHGDLPCGDIGPTVGITSTPVLDPTRGEIFVVDDELDNGVPAHYVLGLDMYTGDVLLRQDVDPPGSYPPALLQRVALTLDDGHVVFGYGGNAGDCSTYRGWVVSVPESGGTVSTYDVTPSTSQGAVWMGGAAPIVDASGNIWAASGNGSAGPGSPYDGSDSVFELSPALQRLQYFAPSTWATDNQNDRDLGSSAPALLSNGTVFQAGKSGTGYVLNQAHLGGIGGQLGQVAICGGVVDGGDAVVGTVVYAPCSSGVLAVQTSPTTPWLTTGWQTPTGSPGPPIVAGGLVWTMTQSGELYGLNPADGTPVHTYLIGSVSNHFPTPSVGAGLLLAASSTQVHAFKGPAGLPGPPEARPAPPGPPGPPGPSPASPGSSYWTVASDGGIFSFGNAPFYGSTGAMHLNQPIVAMAPTPDGGGYWLVAADGGIFAFGDAHFYGSTGATHLNQPIVAMAPTPDGGGYWLVAADGGIFAFGDAHFYGSAGATPLNQPVVGMAPAGGGGGYWLVAADGGIFAFGSARFDGSMGAVPLTRPVVGMAATPDGGGYWLVAADGGIFAFGDASFHGSMGGRPLNRPILGLAVTADGGGYWMVAADGGIFAFGDASFHGSMGGSALNAPMVGMAALPNG